MFKNFLDKAKSAFDDADISKHVATPKNKKPIEFDASFFSFALEGGPLHTEKLTAVGRIKTGEKAGELIPLLCKWFISTPDGKMNEIEGLNGCIYQPCAEDVGCRVSVQAIPVTDGLYTGMPVYGEVGPLVLDETVEEKVMAFLKLSVSEYKVGIEKLRPENPSLGLTFPCLGNVCLNKEEKIIEVWTSNGEEKLQKLFSCHYTDQYPSIEYVRQTTTLFELQGNPQEAIRVYTETSVDRDVLATAIRMFANEDLQNLPEEQEQPEQQEQQEKEEKQEKQEHEEQEKQQEEKPEKPEKSEKQEKQEKQEQTEAVKTRKRNGSSHLEALMKRERLIKQIKQLEKENEQFKKRHQEDTSTKEKLEAQVKEVTDQLQESDIALANLKVELADFKSEKEILTSERLRESEAKNGRLEEELTSLRTERVNLVNEKLFLAQELNIYRSQALELESIVKNYEAQAVPSKESVEKDVGCPEIDETIKGLKQKLARAELEIEQLNYDKETLKKRVTTLTNESELKDANLNSLKRKIQSLVQENEKMANRQNEFSVKSLPLLASSPSLLKGPSILEMSPSQVPSSPTKSHFEFHLDSSMVQNYEEEIRQLKLSNENLVATLETMKVVKEQPSKIQKNPATFELTGGKASREGMDNLEYLQKLVNTLTETIAENHLQIENQKQINRELGRKVTELQELRFAGKTL